MQASCQSGQDSGKDEGNGEEFVHVDAEAFHMFDVLDSGPDGLARDGPVQKEPDAEIDQQRDSDDDQPGDGDPCAQDPDLCVYRGGNRPGNQSPDVFDGAYTGEQNPEGGDHRKGDIPFVNAQKHESFHTKTDNTRSCHPAKYTDPWVSRHDLSGLDEGGAA